MTGLLFNFKRQGIYILFSLILATSCKNLNNKTSSVQMPETPGKAHSDLAITEELPVSPVPADVDANFETFLKHFSSDSLFQVSRTNFPLVGKNIEEDNREQKIIINQDDFRKLTFGDITASTREFDKYQETIKVNGNKAVVEKRGIDNGIYIDVFFEKKNGKWKLIFWLDSST